MIFLIDNGHGADTPGKCSPDRRLLEFQYSREIASAVVARLKGNGIDARLLTPEREDIPLRERVRRANAVCASAGKANVRVISIHVNAAGSGQWMSARGWEAWTSPGQTESDRMAELFYTSAARHLPGMKLRRDLSDGDSDKEARFAILTGTKCPAVLTENLFQDNREDMEFLLRGKGREAITALHVDAVMKILHG